LNKLVLTQLLFCTTCFAADAIMEAACWNKSDYSNYGRNSVADMIKANAYVKERNVIGPNCPGVITQVKQSWYHARFVFKRYVGIVSKSGTLTYEAADQVVKQG
jgi:succinyl-CoA synthetase alpha subunit